MELAQDYIQGACYPIEMDMIEKKLDGFGLAFDEKFCLMGLAIQFNISSIRDSTKLDCIIKSGQDLADRATDSDLKLNGIPKLPSKYIDQYKLTLERNLNVYATDQQVLDYKTDLEKLFYSAYAKRLMSKSLYHVNILNNSLREYIELSKVRIKSELDYLIEDPKQEFLMKECIKVEVEGIQNLFPYLESSSQKRVLEGSVEIYKDFVLSKIGNLLNSGQLDPLEKSFVNCAFSIISRYLRSNEDLVDQYSTFILMTLGFEPDHIPQPITWSGIGISSRLTIYTYIYLIISEELKYIKNLKIDYSFIPNLYNIYHPSSRQILRQISSDFPLLPLNHPSIYTKSPFNWFKLIESTPFDQFAFVPRLKTHSLDLTSILNEKPGHSISTLIEYIKDNRGIRLEKLNESDSSHVTICVSGFLSQEDDHQDQWKALTELYPNTAFYSLTWESSSTFKMILNTMRLNSVNRQFNDCYKEAQIAGSFLAELLMTDGIMMKSCVSLIGFSLGTMVLLQCLDSLSHSNQKLIHDVVFLGSAVPEGLSLKIPEIKENSVSGKMLNVISAHDAVLNNLFTLAGKEAAFGTSVIPGMETIDVSEIVKGHSLYRENLRKIFKTLENF